MPDQTKAVFTTSPQTPEDVLNNLLALVAAQGFHGVTTVRGPNFIVVDGKIPDIGKVVVFKFYNLTQKDVLSYEGLNGESVQLTGQLNVVTDGNKINIAGVMRELVIHWPNGRLEDFPVEVSLGAGKPGTPTTTTPASPPSSFVEDIRKGSEGDDAFSALTSGIYTLIGNGGQDTVTVAGKLSDFLVANQGKGFLKLVNNAKSLVVLTHSVETVRFSDQTILARDLLKSTPSVFDDWLEAAPAGGSVDGLAGNDTIVGSEGPDTLIGGEGNDSLVGGSGDDHLFGGLGANALAGGAGNDTYYVSSAKDVVIESPEDGEDTIIGAVSMNMPANIEHITFYTKKANSTGNALDNRMTGSTGNDILSGGLGNDTLNGRDGNDQLMGGDGDDTLIGGTGKNVATGGAGQDVFVLEPGFMTVKDFTPGQDRLLVSSKIYAAGHSSLAETLEPANFVQSVGAIAKTLEQVFIFDTKKSGFYYDADGSGPGKPVLLATLSGVKALDFNDFGL